MIVRRTMIVGAGLALLLLASLAGAQSVDSVSPDHGPQAGGTALVILGTDMAVSLEDILSITVADVACSDPEFVSVGEIHCTAGAATGGTSGPVVVTTTSNGGLTSEVTYEYNKAPVLVLVEPALGPTSGGTPLSISLEAHPLGDTVTSVTIRSLPCANPVREGALRVLCTSPSVPNGVGGPGPIVVTMSLGGPSTNALSFNFVEAPVIASFAPVAGPVAGGTHIEITGHNFGNVSTELVSVTIGTNPCASFAWVDSTKVTCETGSVEGATRANVSVTTQTGGKGTSTALFSYNLPPLLTAISPTHGPVTGNTTVNITGSSIADGIGDIVSITIAGHPCANPAFPTGSTSLLACTTGAASGPKTGPVIVTTKLAGSSDGILQYTYNPVPHVTGVSPSAGPGEGGTRLTLTGVALGFTASDIYDVTIGGKSCNSTVVWTNSTMISCVSPPADDGVALGTIVVTTASGGSGAAAANAAFVYNEPPLVSSVSPSSGFSMGYTVVQIVGERLGDSLEDVVDVLIAGKSCMYSLTYLSAAHLTCITSTAEASLSGPVQVRTRSGGSSLTANAPTYTYTAQCYLYTSPDECTKNSCSWCDVTANCLTDVESCPIECYVGIVSCGSFIIIFMTVILMILVGVATRVIVHYLNRDEDLKKNLKRNQKRYATPEPVA